jgi:hypothetical protein
MRKIIILIFIDSSSFLVSLFLTYLIFINFQINTVSLLLLKNYSHLTLLLLLSFLIIFNLFGLYNTQKDLFQNSKIILASTFYYLILILCSFIFPKYQLFKTLIFINLTITFFFLTYGRLLSKKIIKLIK